MKLLYTNKNRDSELCHSCNVKVYSDTYNYIFHLNKCEKYTLICADNKVLIYGPSFTDVNSLSIISENYPLFSNYIRMKSLIQKMFLMVQKLLILNYFF